MRLFLLAALTILPGSWLTFGISLDELTWQTRLALGAALSPVVLGLQLFLLRMISLDFPTAVLVILFLNLPCMVLVARSSPKINASRFFSPTFWTALIICSSLVGLMVTLWLAIPNFRTVSWHALLHTDIVYLITRTPSLLEEPDMANTALAAPWMDHVYWSITGWLADWPPTILYPLTNIIWVVITFVLGYELAARGLGLQSSTALLSAGLTFVGTNLVGAATFFVSGNWRLLGDIRYTPLLGKYFGFETIPFAFAIIIGLSLVCVLILEKNTRRLWMLAPVLLIGLGLVYPILFPVGCLLLGLTIFLLWTWTESNRQNGKRISAALAVGFIACVVVFLTYLPAITAERSVSTYQIHTLDKFKTHTRYAAAALLPFLAAALPFIVRGVLRRHRSTILLTLSGVCCIGPYLLFSLSNLEYKFVLCATLLLSPLASGGIEILLWQYSRLRWVITATTPVVLVLFFALLIFKTGVHIPDNLANTPRITEDSFWLGLDRDESDSGWTEAVRRRTPEDTIVVIHNSRIHIASFANRALFFPGLGDGDAMAGYSVPKEYYLLEQRGYSKSGFYSRSKTVHTLYSGTDAEKLPVIIDNLLDLRRPIAIHFPSQDIPFLIWMKRNNVGSELYSHKQNVVWFIDQRTNNFKSRLSPNMATGAMGKIALGE